MSLLRNVAGVACTVFGSLRLGCVGGQMKASGRTAWSLCDGKRGGSAGEGSRGGSNWSS